jgi:hypothetical protein
LKTKRNPVDAISESRIITDGNSGIVGEGDKVGEVIDGLGKSEMAWVGEGEDVVVAGDVEFDEGGREL